MNRQKLETSNRQKLEKKKEEGGGGGEEEEGEEKSLRKKKEQRREEQSRGEEKRTKEEKRRRRLTCDEQTMMASWRPVVRSDDFSSSVFFFSLKFEQGERGDQHLGFVSDLLLLHASPSPPSTWSWCCATLNNSCLPPIRNYNIKCPCCGYKIVLERTSGEVAYKIMTGAVFDWAGWKKECSKAHLNVVAPSSSEKRTIFEIFQFSMMVGDPISDGPFQAV